jgi:hypothetical protein
MRPAFREVLICCSEICWEINRCTHKLALNGEILDMGGIVSYINRQNQLAWGIGLSHVPLRTGYQNYSQASIQMMPGEIAFPALEGHNQPD